MITLGSAFVPSTRWEGNPFFSALWRSRLLMVKPFQIRAARAMLSWSQQQLADHADLNRDTIKSIESGVRTSPASIHAVLEVFEREGLRFSETDRTFAVSVDKRSARVG